MVTKCADDNEFTFTVLTPTYNRARCLERAYRSLEAQSYKDFEWVIVDDGSQDNTKEVVSQLISKASFPIKYVWQENKHKKTAVNNGVKNASGKFISILDSDDELTSNALNDLYQAWNSIPDAEKPNFQGVAGLCRANGKVSVGSPFPEEVYDSDYFTLVYKTRLGGEYFGFTRRDIFLNFLYPEIEGFVPESLIWGKIGALYKTRYINKIVRIYHESDDSIGKGVHKNSTLIFFIKSSEGRFITYHDLINLRLKHIVNDPISLIKSATNYTRSYFHINPTARKKYSYIISFNSWPSRLVVLTFLPLGLFYFVKDKIRLKL